MNRLSALLPAALVLASCSDATSPVSPEPLPSLEAQVWYVQTTDGQPVPGLLGHRTLPGNLLEQDFLDSARIEIDPDGSWVLRGWYQRFRDGSFHSTGTTGDVGTWVATPDRYEFRRATGELLHALAGPLGDELHLDLRYADQEGVAVSVLRRTRPPLTPAGAWRAHTLEGASLPAAYIVEPEFDPGTGVVSRHIMIDSAFVWLHPNDRYVQEIFYSEWEGPANGPPTVWLFGSRERDYGSWERLGGELRLQSAWLQNKVITGGMPSGEAGGLQLNHGISHGDPAAAIQYARR